MEAGVILANLKDAGKIEEKITTLNWQHICLGKNSGVSFKCFYGNV